MNKLYILGNGSFAQEVFEQIIVANQIKNFGGFIILKDDKAFCIGEISSNSASTCLYIFLLDIVIQSDILVV